MEHNSIFSLARLTTDSLFDRLPYINCRGEMMQSTRENKMGTMPVGRLVVTMSLPIILSMLVQACYNVVDSVYISHFDVNALTAVSLAFPAQNLMIGTAVGTATGVNALLSRALGAHEPERARKVAENGVLLAFIGYLIFLLFGLFGSRFFMTTQTKVAEIVDYGVDYLTVCCCISFGIFGEVMFERIIQATGQTIYTMLTQGAGAICNIILDPVFIFRRGEGILGMGVFGMGVKGAAIATVTGQIVACLLAIVINHLKNNEVKMDLKRFKPDIEIIKGIYGIAVPSIIMVAIGSVMTYLLDIILINYTQGKEAAATVFGVYFKLNSFIFMPVFGLNNGMIPIIGYNYGARNRRRMIKAIKTAMLIAFTFMLLGTILFMAFPQVLLGFFNATPQMIEIGIPALRIIASTFIIASICIVIGAVFQALSFGVYSTIVSLGRQLIALVPAAWLLAQTGQRIGDQNLVWYSFPIAEIASLAISMLLFMRLYRNRIAVLPDGNE